jgi:GntR family transcriptional regulator
MNCDFETPPIALYCRHSRSGIIHSKVHSVPVNLYEQVRDSLLGRITGGEFKAGDKLPTEDLLCKEYGVSRITVRRAISELTAQMLISPRRGIGTVVMNRVTGRRVFRLSGFFGQGSGFRVRKIASTTESATADVAKALHISEGALVQHQRYIALHKNEPFTLTDAYEADAEEPSGRQGNGKSEPPPSRRVARAEQELIPIISDALSEKYLGYPAGRPMMEARRIVYASDGLPIHYLILRYHPDRYRFSVDMLPTKGTAIFEARQD